MSIRKLFGNSQLTDIWLPVNLPEYAFGPAYALGSLTASTLVILAVTGIVLAIGGPQWWSFDPNGAMLRSIHKLAFAFFFLFLGLHTLRVFICGAWRGKREITWVLGAAAALVALPLTLTGLALRGEPRAAAGSMSAGLADIGVAFQSFNLHVLALPILFGLLLAAHVYYVRKKSVVPPYPLSEENGTTPATDVVKNYAEVPTDFVKHLLGTLALALIISIVFGFLAAEPPRPEFAGGGFGHFVPGEGSGFGERHGGSLLVPLFGLGLICSILLLAIPWIPWLNRLPRPLGLYKLVWGPYYAKEDQ